MSKLRWNSKQLLPKQYDNQSIRSNKSQSFQKFTHTKRDSSFTINNQEKDKSFALTKIKRNSFVTGNTPNLKSTTNIMCNITRGKNKYINQKIKPNQKISIEVKQTLQKKQILSQKQKIKKILHQAQTVLKDACKLFHYMKKQFDMFHSYMLTQYLKFMAHTDGPNSVMKNQSLENSPKNINYDNNQSGMKNNFSLNTQSFAEQIMVKITKPIGKLKNFSGSMLNNVRKTQSLTYPDLHQQKDTNLLIPSSISSKPMFQGLRNKITQKSNQDRKALLISHSHIQIKKPAFDRTNIHRQRAQNTTTYASSTKNSNLNPNNIQLISQLKDSTFSSRQGSPMAKQIQLKFGNSLKNMKNIMQQA